MLNATFGQPLQHRRLGGLGLVPKRVMDEAALFSLSVQGGSAAQVCLVSEHDEKFRLLPVSGVFRHPERDLLRSDRLVRRAALTTGARRSDGAYRSGGSCNRSEEHTSELQSRLHLVCRLL